MQQVRALPADFEGLNSMSSSVDESLPPSDCLQQLHCTSAHRSLGKLPSRTEICRDSAWLLLEEIVMYGYVMSPPDRLWWINGLLFQITLALENLGEHVSRSVATPRSFYLRQISTLKKAPFQSFNFRSIFSIASSLENMLLLMLLFLKVCCIWS